MATSPYLISSNFDFIFQCDFCHCRRAERLTSLKLFVRYVLTQGQRFDSSIAKKLPSAQTYNPPSFEPFQAYGSKARGPTFNPEVISSHGCGYSFFYVFMKLLFFSSSCRGRYEDNTNPAILLSSSFILNGQNTFSGENCKLMR